MIELMRAHAEGKGFPEDSDGHIVSPRYTQSTEYRSRLREWVKANPDRIPGWLAADMRLMRAGRRK